MRKKPRSSTSERYWRMISAVNFPNRLNGTVQRTLVPAAAVVASLLTLASAGFADDRAKIEQQLNSQYAITTPTADNTDIVTAGAVLVLQKKGLSTGDATSNVPFQNSYK